MDQIDRTLPSANKLWSILSIAVVLLLFYLLAVRIGVVCFTYGFNGDCCWLLRTGKLICDTGSLPQQDPFSFALEYARQHGDPRPYTVYQWLSEVIFYQAYRCLNLVQIIALASSIYVLSFITIPLRSCLRFNVSRPWLFSLIILAGLTSNLRNFVRPEVFTYLITAILMYLLQSQRLKYDEGTQTNMGWRTISVMVVLLVLSCNLHISFVVHLLILFWYSLVFLAEDLIHKKEISAVSKTVLLGTLFSTAATVINPYGIRLWFAVPQILFSPMAPYVVEMQKISMSLLVSAPIFLAYAALLIMAYLSIAFSIMLKPEEALRNLRSPLRLSSFLFIVICTVLGFHTVRYTVIGSMLIVFELTSLIASRQKVSEQDNGEQFWKRKYSFLALEVAVSLFAAFGAVYWSFGRPQPVIPTGHVDFIPPFQGIKYLLEHYDGGHLFTDNEVAGMCELYLPKCSIFVDTRFDGYDTLIYGDYLKILLAKSNWKEILNGYKVEWVLARRQQPIADALQSQSDWKIVYEDRLCVIFRKI
jgi:hypothetical protein